MRCEDIKAVSILLLNILEDCNNANGDGRGVDRVEQSVEKLRPE